MIEYCECEDCRQADTPCKHLRDCEFNYGELCKGCRDQIDYEEEVKFEIDKAQGKI